MLNVCRHRVRNVTVVLGRRFGRVTAAVTYMYSSKNGIKIVHAGELDLNTQQTPGNTRAAAVTHSDRVKGRVRMHGAIDWNNLHSGLMQPNRFVSTITFGGASHMST